MQELVALLLFLSTCSCQVVVPLLPAVVIPAPGDSDLDEATALFCGILPDTTEYIITWTAPNGTSFTPHDLATLCCKYTIQNGRISSVFPQGSILTVMRLSYLDSGNYTCSVEFTGGPSAGMTGSASIELSLLAQVEAVVLAVNASEGSSPGLACEMKDYIHSDSDFQWRRGDDIITNTSKHSITYSEGLHDRARDGGHELVSSRISTLTIADIDESDAGQYTCFVRGTEEAATVELSVSSDSVVTPKPFTTGAITQATPDPPTEDSPNMCSMAAPTSLSIECVVLLFSTAVSV